MRPSLTPAPYLQAGDNLTREEFLSIWETLPNLKRAELIGGVVFMPSPQSPKHGDMENNMSGWICFYKAATPGCAAGNNASAIILEDCPQADINLRIMHEFGGKSWVENNLLHGTPEMFVEVCLSSASYDLHQKLDLYEEAGIPEYLAVIVKKKQIHWHRLARGKYELMRPDSEGVYRSRVFPGLWLDSKALFKDDMAHVLATLQEGIASEEHRRFVQKLAARQQSQ